MLEFRIYYPTSRLINNPPYDEVRIEFVLPKRPFLFWVERRAGDALNLPKGYGVAWADWSRHRLLYAPMPLNIIICCGMWLYYLVRAGAARELSCRMNRLRVRK